MTRPKDDDVSTTQGKPGRTEKKEKDRGTRVQSSQSSQVKDPNKEFPVKGKTAPLQNAAALKGAAAASSAIPSTDTTSAPVQAAPVQGGAMAFPSGKENYNPLAAYKIPKFQFRVKSRSASPVPKGKRSRHSLSASPVRGDRSRAKKRHQSTGIGGHRGRKRGRRTPSYSSSYTSDEASSSVSATSSSYESLTDQSFSDVPKDKVKIKTEWGSATKPIVVPDMTEKSSVMSNEEATSATLSEYMARMTEDDSGALLMDSNLADLVDKLWPKTVQVPKDLLDTYKKPANIENILKVSCNEEVLAVIPRHTRVKDMRFRSFQGALATAVFPILRVVDQLCRPLSEILPRSQLATMALDSIQLIAYASNSLNQYRRELMKPVLHPKLAALCHRNFRPTGQWLFEEDLHKLLRDRAETFKLGRKYTGSGRSHFKRKFRKFRGYSHKAKDGHKGGHFGEGSLISSLLVNTSLEFIINCETGSQSREIANVTNVSFDRAELEEEKAPQAVGGHHSVSYVTKPTPSDVLLPVSHFSAEFISLWGSIEQEEFCAGNLSNHLPAWKELTSDKFILQTVHGMLIEFEDEIPSQHFPKFPLKVSARESDILSAELLKLIDKKVIEPCEHVEGEFLSTVFTRQKRDSSKFRLILNLSDFNLWVVYKHFKMDTLQTALALIYPGCFCASIDLKDAYYTVNVDPSARKFLRFTFDGQLYQFTCLPNGLTSGPREFTKLLKPVLAHLRQEYGITILSSFHG